MNGKQTEEARTGTTGTGYAVMPRPVNGSPYGLRQQIADGQYAAAPQDPAVAQKFGPGAAAAEAPAIAAKPPTELQMPAIPAMPVAAAAAGPAVVAQMALANPAPAPVVNSVTTPPAPMQSDEPLRQPEWPQLSQPVSAPHAVTPSDVAPMIEPASATAPASSQSAQPSSTVVAPPEPVREPEASTSLKIAAPAAMEVQPAAPSPTAFTAPAASTAPAAPVASTAPAAPAVSTAAAPAVAETILFQALRAFQNDRPQEALEHLRRLDPTNQELLMYLMPLMVRLSEGGANALPPEELAMLIDRLQTASSMLKSKATLRADRVCFCRGVRKFADLDTYEAGHEFRPGDMVFLYAELKNFTCEPVAVPAGATAPAHGWNIRLGTKLELRDVRNNLIWRTDLNKNDFAQTPPQDYYHTYRFCVPDKLPPGTYTLWLTIVDKPTGRAVRKPVEMRIGQS
jgi:hypothetical protein